MKRLKLYLSALMLMSLAVACNDDFDTPPMVVPHAQHQANMTIADFKAKYWHDGRNCIDTCKDDTYIHGYVTSSDEEGNIYKYLYIQDETAGLGISIDANSIYNTYRVGQEIVISMKDFWIGKYNGQYLIGKPEWYSAQSAWEAGRMTLDEFNSHVEINGLPNVNNIAPVELDIADVVGHSDTDTQLQYQGQFVIIRNVEWEAADGTTTFSEASATTTRVLVDENGNKLNVTNSNYANFRSETLPVGKGDVQGILYMTGDDQWKLYLRDANDCIGFPDNLKGYLVDPYTVSEAIELQGQDKNGWVQGYIVGVVGPEVSAVSSSSDIEWTAPFTLDNTIVIADAPDVVDYNRCIVVPLPQGSSFRNQASLRKYPELLGTKILVKGDLNYYMEMAGLTNNSGSTDEYKLSIITGGLTELTEDFNGGAVPSGWKTVVVAGDKDWFFTATYNTFISVSGYNGKNPPFDAWLITPALDIRNAENKTFSFQSQVNTYGGTTSMLEVYLMSTDDPATAELIKLNPTLASTQGSGFTAWTESGDIDLSQFEGTYCIGFRYYATTDANYHTWRIDNFRFGGSLPLQTIDDFETLNGGTATSQTSFANFTSTKGWVVENAGILKGGENDSAPTYKMIGKKADDTGNWAYAAHLNGKTTAPGKITSPVLHNGVGTLKLSYGYVLTETNGVQFRVNVKNVATGAVTSYDVKNTTAAKSTAYTWEQAVNQAGDFQIEIVPLSPSNSTSNKDRFAVWNITWDNFQ